jgi:hypothetical protein
MGGMGREPRGQRQRQRSAPATSAEARRQRVLAAMRALSATATQELIAALEDDDALVREWAIEGLSRRPGREQAASRLLARLKDDRADVRWYAARALGKLRAASPEVRDALIGGLNDADEYVRCFAAWAIGMLGFADAVPALTGRLQRVGRARRGLEAQTIGVALARLNTSHRESAEEHQGLLFDKTLLPEALPERLPSTKTEVLQAELLKTAESILLDRAGGPVVLTGKVRMTMQYVQSVSLKERILEVRGRRCQLCGFTFRKANGLDYAEAHHVRPLSQRGPDTPDNVLVLCANHHRQLHLADTAYPQGTTRPSEVLINGERIPVRWPSTDSEG